MKTNTKDLVLTAVFAAIICVFALISVPVGEISFTLAVFAVFLAGGLLKPANAFLAVIVYILIGIVGAPVFSGLQGGVGVLVGFTGGFLMSFPFMALITALSVRLFKKRSVLSLSLGMLCGLAVCYAMGTAWFMFVAKAEFSYALKACVIPFIPFDLIKIVFAVILSLVLSRQKAFKFDI